MQLNSLGYRTDLFFPAFDGMILDRGEYLVVRTPSNPTYYWGNFILFSSPAVSGDVERWSSIFEIEIGSPPEVLHQTFGWDSTDGELGVIEPFMEIGFRLSKMVVLTARSLIRPSNASLNIDIRPCATDHDWMQALENQVRCRDPEHDESHYRTFKRDQMLRYRTMVEAGLGAWYGAFHKNDLVGDLGVFHNGELGRYQSVETHPAHRRSGIARNLAYQAAEHAMEYFELKNLVIVAEKGSVAERLYLNLGFQQKEIQLGIERW